MAAKKRKTKSKEKRKRKRAKGNPKKRMTASKIPLRVLHARRAVLERLIDKTYREREAADSSPSRHRSY